MKATHDRDIDCALAMEKELSSLILHMETRGWTRDEVANALLSLAQQKFLELGEDLVIEGAGQRIH